MPAFLRTYFLMSCWHVALNDLEGSTDYWYRILVNVNVNVNVEPYHDSESSRTTRSESESKSKSEKKGEIGSGDCDYRNAFYSFAIRTKFVQWYHKGFESIQVAQGGIESGESEGNAVVGDHDTYTILYHVQGAQQRGSRDYGNAWSYGEAFQHVSSQFCLFGHDHAYMRSKPQCEHHTPSPRANHPISI